MRVAIKFSFSSSSTQHFLHCSFFVCLLIGWLAGSLAEFQFQKVGESGFECAWGAIETFGNIHVLLIISAGEEEDYVRRSCCCLLPLAPRKYPTCGKISSLRRGA